MRENKAVKHVIVKYRRCLEGRVGEAISLSSPLALEAGTRPRSVGTSIWTPPFPHNWFLLPLPVFYCKSPKIMALVVFKFHEVREAGSLSTWGSY